jgi:dipeptidyl aminopeptidase/acylaminoacyl peptidase
MSIYRILLLQFIIFIFLPGLCLSQTKKEMNPDVYKTWKKISNVKMSHNGDIISYIIQCEECDPELNIYNTKDNKTIKFQRAKNIHISPSGKFIVFEQHMHRDTLKKLKLSKVRKEDIPKDTLVIHDLYNKTTELVTTYNSFQFPDEYEDWIIYNADMNYPEGDSSKDDKSMEYIVVKNLKSGISDTLNDSGKFFLSDYLPKLIYETKINNDSILSLELYNLNTKTSETILEGNYKVENLVYAKNNEDYAFITSRTDSKNNNTDIALWYPDENTNLISITKDEIPNMEKGWTISQTQLSISDNGERIYFWKLPPPLEQDTTLLPEDIVQLELWNYKDQLLYTQKETRLDEEKKKAYLSFIDVKNEGKIINLAKQERSYVRIDQEHNQPYAIEVNSKPYQKYISWKGYSYNDIYLIDLSNGKKKLISSKENGTPLLSPASNYIYWFNREEGVYKIYNINKGKTEVIISDDEIPILNETNDTPQFPGSYGFAGWTPDDKYFLVYDRYDIWKVDPLNHAVRENLTNARSSEISYRIVKLDKDEKIINLQNNKILLEFFNHISKSKGYCYLVNGKIEKPLDSNGFRFNGIQKAKNANTLIFTKESYLQFPNLILADSSFSSLKIVSDANPQAKEYKWGTIELFEWNNDNGEPLEGLLVLPEDFDPRKKYPLLVNFYERSSDGLHRHRAPYAHRSTINYTYYSSKGYIIFNPDVTYEVGHPGRSCFEDVISGIDALLKEGYINKNKIGVQGHSWGGYQVAHLLTKTNLFACAEAGAPVVNMVSAYGGIRWRSGMSRMFQYERTQSRLGATLWEKPELYLENSPIFNMDKVTTPILILHNDKDGAVPWYQGIEYFVALRRLNKPAWFLNYNNEPHWPVKWPNRLDFNIRMEQFFDYYLMDKPMPLWMKEGIDPIEKGINQKID